MSLFLLVAGFVSGLCALIYQVVWIHEMALLVGGTVPALGMVSAVFFLGLIGGSLSMGFLMPRIRKPLLVYASVELGIAFCALALVFVFTLLREGNTFSWWPGAGIPDLVAVFGHKPTLLRLVAPMLLLVPTLGMGCTLPLLCACFSTSTLNSQRFNVLYACNTLGAAGGVFLASFFLLPRYGYSRTLVVSLLLNAALALVTLAVYHCRQSKSTAAANGGSSLSAFLVHPVLLLCMATGFLYMALEIVLLRSFLFYFPDSFLLNNSILFAVILSCALGAGFFAHGIGHTRRPELWLRVLLGGACLGFLAALLLPWAMPAVVAAVNTMPAWGLFLFIFLCLGPLFFFMGALLPVCVRLLQVQTNLLPIAQLSALLYAANTLGCMLGALVCSLVLLPVLGLERSVLILLFLYLICMYASFSSPKSLPAGLARFGLVVLAGSVGFFFFRPIEVLPQLLAQKFPQLTITAVQEGESGISWAARDPSGEHFLLDTQVIISRDQRGAFISQGYVPYLLQAEPVDDVLGLCFGGGLSYQAFWRSPEVKRLDFVDISSANIELSLQNFPMNKGLADDPRVHFYYEDAFFFLRVNSQNYDAILIEPTPPSFGFRASKFYTTDFYSQAQARLRPNGVFSQVLPIGQLSLYEAQSIMKSFAAVFPHAYLWWNGLDPVMLGFASAPAFDLNKIEERLSRLDSSQQALAWNTAPRLENILAGLLLSPEEFRAFSSAGEILRVDHSLLEYSQAAFAPRAFLLELQKHLAPWEQIARSFPKLTPNPRNAEVLTHTRNKLLSLSYANAPNAH